MQTLDEVLDCWSANVLRVLSQQIEFGPQGIHHYTSESALSSILSGRSLWATRSDSFPEDVADCARYIRAFSSCFQQRFPHFPNSESLDAAIAEFRKDVFVTSFCEADNDPEVWKKHGHAGLGYALRFSLKPTEDGDRPMPTPVLRSVRYDVDDGMRRGIESDLKNACYLGREYGTGEDDERVARHLVRLAAHISPSWKDHELGWERELRWVVKDDALIKLQPFIKQRFRDVQAQPVEYVEIPFDDDALKGITVGPGRVFKSSKAQLTQMLKLHTFDPDKIEIKKSEIPWA